jgi:thioesterase domain-containing protein
MGYLPLARALGPALPVYGLQALDQPLAASIGDMAARYLAAIRDVQPHGPYRLLGHSFGGLVAFETTRQLEAAGEAVSLLALLDTSIPDAQGEAGPGGGAAEALLVAEAVGAGLSDGPQATANEDLAALVRHNIRLAAGYAPGQVQAPLTYIKALGDGREDGRDAFWRARSAHALPTVDHVGGHFQMLSADSAEGLAALIRHRL